MVKKIIILIIIISNKNLLIAQNVGIGTTEPMNKLQVAGNLLVSSPTTATGTAPSPGQIKTMLNAGTINFVAADSTGRIYDPGGAAGNYLPNTTAQANIASSSNTGIEITVESMDLNTGDSLIIKETSGSSVYLKAVGNGYNSTGKWVFNSTSLYIIFKSNADAGTAAGFSLLFRRLYDNSASLPEVSGIAGSVLLFDTKNGSFRSGLINNAARGNYSIATGNNTSATGISSTAMGDNTTASGFRATAFGYNTTATGVGSTALGQNTLASGSYGTAMGVGTTGSGDYSTAIGYSSTAGGDYSIALGTLTNAAGNYSTSLGRNTNATGYASIAMGSNTTALNIYSTSLGYGTTASGAYSTATGKYTNATGYASIATGDSSLASGTISFASGIEAIASGGYSTAIGYYPEASGTGSIAMGATTASGGFSIAMGSYSTTASGDFSIAMGTGTTASGFSSTSMGASNIASGDHSTAMGNYVNTNNQNGAFLIGDYSTTTVMNGTTPNNFRARFDGGYRFYTSSDYSTSCALSPGANAWSTTSDMRLKENFETVNGEEFLKKIATMRLVSWNYKKQDPSKFRHYGPMAQEFYAAFGKDKYGNIGNDTTINQADFDGVNLIAIQALEKRTRLQQQQIEQQNTIILQLRKELDELKKK